MKLLEHNLNPKIEILLIENKTDILADELPPLVDIDEFNSFKTDKRRSEHVSARFALGSILEKWGLDVDQMKIVRDSIKYLDEKNKSEGYDLIEGKNKQKTGLKSEVTLGRGRKQVKKNG